MRLSGFHNRLLVLFGLVLLTAIISVVAGMNGKQVVALTTMLSFIYGTLLFWRMRVGFAFAGIAALFFFGVLDIAHFVEFASLDIIVFLIAMMVVIGFLEKNQFF